MTDLPMNGLHAKQQPIHVDVAYYDDTEKRKLSAYPTAQKLSQLVSTDLQVNAAQFLTYYLFYRKRPGKLGYRNYAAIGAHIDQALIELDGWVDYVDGSLVSACDAVPQDKAVTERIGEAGALCVASRIHDLHEADWQKIPEHRGPHSFPTFDYRFDTATASDGTYVIQVEAKGTAVEDSSILTASAKVQKARIDKKKERIQLLEAEDSYPYPADLRYGVLCAIGRTGRLRCWLTDPPSEGSPDARRYRLLARLQFMFDWISVLNGRSQLAASLGTRLLALYGLKNPFELEGMPLVRGNGEPFEIPRYARFERPQGMFAHMCRVTDGPAVGTLVKSPGGQLFFIGVQRQIYEMVARQDFEAILNYREPGGTTMKQVDCVIPWGRAKRMGIAEFDEEQRRDHAYVRFRSSALLHYGEGSSVFGIVTPPGMARGDGE